MKNVFYINTGFLMVFLLLFTTANAGSYYDVISFRNDLIHYLILLPIFFSFLVSAIFATIFKNDWKKNMWNIIIGILNIMVSIYIFLINIYMADLFLTISIGLQIIMVLMPIIMLFIIGVMLLIFNKDKEKGINGNNSTKTHKQETNNKEIKNNPK